MRHRPRPGPPGPRRVLHAVSTSLGIDTQILPLAEALAERGWEVDVASPAGPETAAITHPRIRHLPIPFTRRLWSAGHAVALGRLCAAIGRGSYALAHLHGPMTAVLGRVAARPWGVPVVYHCRGTLYERDPEPGMAAWTPWTYRALERALAGSTRWVFTLNGGDAADLERRAGIPLDRITCLGVGGCGLDLAVWSPDRFDARSRAATREGLGVPPGRPVMGFVGRLVRVKGVLELVEAFHAVRAAGVDAHLLVVGDTPASERDQETAPRMRARIAALGLSEHVTFAGRLARTDAATAALDLLVLPSTREAYGNVLAEAGALGVPVVATASRGALECVVPGETGLLVPKGDAAALAEAMLRILRDPGLAERLGAAAARRARERWSRERAIGTMLEVYDRILAERVEENAAPPAIVRDPCPVPRPPERSPDAG